MHQDFCLIHIFKLKLSWDTSAKFSAITDLFFIITRDVTILAFVFKKLSIFNQHALDFIVGRPCYLKMAQQKYMENVGYVQEDREQMHRNIVSLAQSLQNCMTGSILDLWLCFLLFYIGSSLNGTRGKRVPAHFSSTSLHCVSAVRQPSSPFLWVIQSECFTSVHVEYWCFPTGTRCFTTQVQIMLPQYTVLMKLSTHYIPLYLSITHSVWY